MLFSKEPRKNSKSVTYGPCIVTVKLPECDVTCTYQIWSFLSLRNHPLYPIQYLLPDPPHPFNPLIQNCLQGKYCASSVT